MSHKCTLVEGCGFAVSATLGFDLALSNSAAPEEVFKDSAASVEKRKGIAG
jgi:hypothetical protein